MGCHFLFLGLEDPLEEGMAAHSSILAWRIPWTGLHRVRHDWSNWAQAHLYPIICLTVFYFTHVLLFFADASSVQLLSCVRLFATPWTAARQASLSIINSQSPPKPMSIESMMPSNHLIPCRPLLLLPSIFPSIRGFSNKSALRIRWPKYWSFSFSISPSNEHPGLISFRMAGWISLQSKGLSRVFSNTTVQKHQFLMLSFLYGPTLTSIHDYWKNHSFDYTDLWWQSDIFAF